MATNAKAAATVSRSTHRLNQIDTIRANGVGDSISLPQLVVCGDQSSGKSSVLERLSGIPFPQNENLCTRFPTEIILRHANGPQQITSSIHPHSTQPSGIQDTLKQYHRELSDVSELPSVIHEAAALMQISGYGNPDANKAFAADVLRIEVTGPTGIHLTIVDLPGLISVTNDEQTEEDVNIVRGLVESYISSSRTIILAVIQAPNDIANQSIIQLARKYDPEGKRTVGILTKTDLINEASQHTIANLAKNLGAIRLKLGFFLLKNPSPSERSDKQTLPAQSQEEIEFFAQLPWKSENLDEDRVGVDKLKPFLQDLLDDHIERELPKVCEEIRSKVIEVEKELEALGPERRTVGQIRSALIGASMRFHQLAQAAHNGSYEANINFFSDHKNRLRATVHSLNKDFSDYMRDNGGKRKIQLGKNNRPTSEASDRVKLGQLLVTTNSMTGWVKTVYAKSRGRELPGNYNHVFLAELFHEQSSRWPTIANDLVARVIRAISEWIEAAVRCSVNEDRIRCEILKLCREAFGRTTTFAAEELLKLLDDEKRHPITYNHYYTDNVQKSRNGAPQQSNSGITSSAAENQNDSIKDMDEQACNEGLIALNSYYKVAMKTFIDNVCRQVIERHFMSSVRNIFSPRVVADLSDDELLRIGSESQQQLRKRDRLKTTALSLRKSLKELQIPPTEFETEDLTNL